MEHQCAYLDHFIWGANTINKNVHSIICIARIRVLLSVQMVFMSQSECINLAWNYILFVNTLKPPIHILSNSLTWKKAFGFYLWTIDFPFSLCLINWIYLRFSVIYKSSVQSYFPPILSNVPMQAVLKVPLCSRSPCNWFSQINHATHLPPPLLSPKNLIRC